MWKLKQIDGYLAQITLRMTSHRLDITLLLSKQNLASHSNREDESSQNKRNFLELVHMLLKYDPVLKEHIMRLKQRAEIVKASACYLLPTTPNEFTGALARHVWQSLVEEIKFGTVLWGYVSQQARRVPLRSDVSGDQICRDRQQKG